MSSAQGQSYELVQTAAGAQRALAHMAKSSFLTLDLEGYKLGCAGGALSLVCVGTRTSGVFLFDAVVLEPSVLHEVLRFVANPHKVKFMWDARKDFSELYHGYDISIHNIIDLQIVDILERSRATYGTDGRLWTLDEERLQPRVHRLLGLKSVPKVYNIPALGSQLGEWARQRHEDWMMRPLPASMLDYAARDITILDHTREHFFRRGFLNDMYTLTAQSVRYSTIHAPGRPESDNPFQGSNLLPLEILFDVPQTAPRLECAACRRWLTRRSFDGQECTVAFVCRVCSILRRQHSQSDWVSKWEYALRNDYPFDRHLNEFPSRPFEEVFAFQVGRPYYCSAPTYKNLPHAPILFERGAADRYLELEAQRRVTFRRVLAGENMLL